MEAVERSVDRARAGCETLEEQDRIMRGLLPALRVQPGVMRRPE